MYSSRLLIGPCWNLLLDIFFGQSYFFRADFLSYAASRLRNCICERKWTHKRTWLFQSVATLYLLLNRAWHCYFILTTAAASAPIAWARLIFSTRVAWVRRCNSRFLSMNLITATVVAGLLEMSFLMTRHKLSADQEQHPIESSQTTAQPNARKSKRAVSLFLWLSSHRKSKFLPDVSSHCNDDGRFSITGVSKVTLMLPLQLQSPCRFSNQPTFKEKSCLPKII